MIMAKVEKMAQVLMKIKRSRAATSMRVVKMVRVVRAMREVTW